MDGTAMYELVNYPFSEKHPILTLTVFSRSAVLESSASQEK